MPLSWLVFRYGITSRDDASSPSATNGALRWGVDASESPQDALIEVEVLTVREGVDPVTALLYELCCELGEFVDTPDTDACPVLMLPTEAGRAAIETGLDEDKSELSTLSFLVVETATSIKVCSGELDRRGKKR